MSENTSYPSRSWIKLEQQDMWRPGSSPALSMWLKNSVPGASSAYLLCSPIPPHLWSPALIYPHSLTRSNTADTPAGVNVKSAGGGGQRIAQLIEDKLRPLKEIFTMLVVTITKTRR